jgi:hypothetical protein
MDIQSILPQKGVVPPRPTTLKHPDGLAATQTDEVVIELLKGGRVAAYGGLSLLGDSGHIVYMVGLLQAKDENLKGWTLAIGHPNQEKPDFNRIDTTTAPLTELPFPNTMTYFVGEADEKLIAANVPPEELQAAARFILPFISDEGPPQGIDW